MIHRSVFEEIGYFDEKFIVCEDYELWLRITLAFEIGFIEKPIIIKHGGHPDQLSHKFVAMDYWRVKALRQILENPKLTTPQKRLVLMEIQRKGNILLKGFVKHNNFDNFSEIQEILS